VIKGVKSPVKYAEGLMTFSNVSNAGFKVKVYQLDDHQNLDPAKTLKLFESKGWKIIYLKRSNLFEHAISDLYSEYTGHYHNINTDGKSAKKPLLPTSFEEIVHVIKTRERYHKSEVEALKDVDFLDIEYERDLCDAQSQAKSMNRVFSFLGLAPYAVSTSFKKVVSKDFGEVIKDYSSIKRKLENSEYAKYLN
jgi:LPS sulfotransferase NodH